MTALAKALSNPIGKLLIVLLLLLATVWALGKVGGTFNLSLNFSVK